MLSENIGSIFGGNKREKQEDYEKEKQKMQVKIGELTLRVDFLKKVRAAREIEHADEAWCADITYIPMERGTPICAR